MQTIDEVGYEHWLSAILQKDVDYAPSLPLADDCAVAGISLRSSLFSEASGHLWLYLQAIYCNTYIDLKRRL